MHFLNLTKRLVGAASALLLLACGATAQSYPTPRFKSVNEVVFSSGFAGADWCANLQSAIAALPSGGTIIVDDLQTISTCSASATITPAANTTIKFTSPGDYYLSEPLQLTDGDRLEGLGGGRVRTVGGARLIALGSFPTDAALVKVWDAANAQVNDLVLDCNGVVNCRAIQYDGDNNPITTHGVFSNLTLQNSHWAFVCGTTTLPQAVTGITVSGSGPYTATVTVGSTLPWAVGSTHGVAQIRAATPSTFDTSGAVITVTSATTFTLQYTSNPGTWTSGGTVIYGNEADQADISNVVMSGNGIDTNAQGFFINSADCFQQTTIRHVFGQLLHYWVNGYASNGGVRFEDFDGGSWIGTNNRAFWFQDSWLGNYILTNSETEGTTGTGAGQLQYGLLDSSGTLSGKSGAVTLNGNSFFAGGVDLLGNGYYLSFNNTFAGTAQAFGTTVLCSIQDTGTAWTTAGGYNLGCKTQGIGEGLSGAGSGVTITNAATLVSSIGQDRSGKWSVNSQVSFGNASASAVNVQCWISDSTTTYGQAIGYASNSSNTNLSINAIATSPAGNLATYCQTTSAGATAVTSALSRMTATRISN